MNIIFEYAVVLALINFHLEVKPREACIKKGCVTFFFFTSNNVIQILRIKSSITVYILKVENTNFLFYLNIHLRSQTNTNLHTLAVCILRGAILSIMKMKNTSFVSSILQLTFIVYIHIVSVEWMLWIQSLPQFSFCKMYFTIFRNCVIYCTLRKNLMSIRCLCKKLHMRKMTEKVKNRITITKIDINPIVIKISIMLCN